MMSSARSSTSSGSPRRAEHAASRRILGAALFWLGVGVFVTWQGWLLELGTLHEPGSGFVFFWLGLFMSALSLSITVAGARGEGAVAGRSLARGRGGATS
jgi:predicted anti-sigma-YlaC factor YlaD